MLSYKEPEILFHMAALGHTGALRSELDYWATDGGLGHGFCINLWMRPSVVHTNWLDKHLSFLSFVDTFVKPTLQPVTKLINLRKTVNYFWDNIMDSCENCQIMQIAKLAAHHRFSCGLEIVIYGKKIPHHILNLKSSIKKYLKFRIQICTLRNTVIQKKSAINLQLLYYPNLKKASEILPDCIFM